MSILIICDIIWTWENLVTNIRKMKLHLWSFVSQFLKWNNRLRGRSVSGYPGFARATCEMAISRHRLYQITCFAAKKSPRLPVPLPVSLLKIVCYFTWNQSPSNALTVMAMKRWCIKQVKDTVQSWHAIPWQYCQVCGMMLPDQVVDSKHCGSMSISSAWKKNKILIVFYHFPDIGMSPVMPKLYVLSIPAPFHALFPL